MQEAIVLIVAITALIYLCYKFIFKKKSQACDKCELPNQKELKRD